MTDVSEFVRELAAAGRYHFTTADAVQAVGKPINKVRAELRSLEANGELVDPYRSFHVILPVEDRRIGCPPAEQLLPPLMQHLHEPYYVALLSAAEVHGAGHLPDELVQVMARRNRKAIACGKSRVQFVGRKDLDQTPLVECNLSRGVLRVSSPEATALELVGYADQCGGLGHVAAIISELGAVLSSEDLAAVASLGPIAWAQRLGYLLDITDNRQLGNALAPVVRDLANDFAPLVRARRKGGATRLPRWKLVVNADV